MDINLNPQKGFRDLYPQEKTVQNYIFETLKKVSATMGFEPYDGPLLEDIQIYLNKTSEELINRQTFQVKDKKDQTLVLRPEMTPSLARMIANKAGELTFPLKLFNLGLRYRYEAPQKGREREFYQADYDILGTTSIVADAEIIATAVNIFLSLGAKENDFKLYFNSRSFVEEKLIEKGFQASDIKRTLSLIDKKDKMSSEEFSQELQQWGKPGELLLNLLEELNDQASIIKKSEYFQNLVNLLKEYGVNQYIEYNSNIVRGLDYYSGLVFEVKELGGMSRSLLGGGRYDNLVSTYNEKLNISGVGFATSDVVLWEFIKDKNLVPQLNSKQSKVLVTIFDQTTINESIKIVTELRNNNISAELYPDPDKKIDKQLKYADKNNIPFVIIIGPQEAEKKTVMLKNMKAGEQKEVPIDDLITTLKA